MGNINRFRSAQQSAVAGVDAALAEIRSGHKSGHWIWYIFPQLAGLGHSAMSRSYGIDGIAEAVAYLEDEELRRRLLTTTTAVAEQLRAGVSLTCLMGSSLDAQKLISSLTLFGALARRLTATADRADYRQLADVANEVLTCAESEGYPRCSYTVRRLAQHTC